MPNWCENKILIRGTKQQRKEFKAKYCKLVKVDWRDKEIWALDFNKVIPQPKSIEECPEEFIIHNEEEARKEFLNYDENNERRWFNWYRWACHNWGTKWNASPYDSRETDVCLTLWFDTPWSPPDPIISKLILDNYDLKITGRYDEPNMDIHGWYTYKDWLVDKIKQEEGK